MEKPAALIAEQNESLRRNMKGLLARQGFEVIECSSRVGAFRSFHNRGPELVIIGSARDGSWDELEVARQIRQWDRKVPLILITANSSEELAIAALRAGVNDYFRPPFSLDELGVSIHRCLTDRLARDASPTGEGANCSLPEGQRIIGESTSMREIKAYIAKVAVTDSNVLITGETGTGKELVAELIHRTSPRRRKPFVCINCAAIPDSLLESELFGHERGAFTGADSFSEGEMKLGDGGTVFFDEIGDMSSCAQAKILRAIESREAHRLGGRGTVPLNVRVIAATNQDLEQLVSADRFRRDLYFRLNVARIHLPPLRDRKEDITFLCDHYIRELNRRFGREIEGFTDVVLEHLLRYEWPGNVRELKNLLEAIFVTVPSGRISVADLPEQFQRRFKDAGGPPRGERECVLSALFATRWNKSRAARQLHWSRMTLYRKMAKYRLVQGGGVGDDISAISASRP